QTAPPVHCTNAPTLDAAEEFATVTVMVLFTPALLARSQGNAPTLYEPLASEVVSQVAFHGAWGALAISEGVLPVHKPYCTFVTGPAVDTRSGMHPVRVE